MFAELRSRCGVTTFFTDRQGGVSKGGYASFNLGLFSGDSRTDVAQNRALLCEALHIPSRNLVVPNEVHGNKVMALTEESLLIPEEERDEYFRCDALVTDQPGICLGVTVADCVPVLLYEENGGVVAAAHAGWKGIVSNVLGETIREMRMRYGVTPDKIRAEILPSISSPCFEVGEEVVEKFGEVFPTCDMDRFVITGKYAKPHIDLRMAVRLQLLSCGIPEGHVWSSPDCTYSDARYFSARRDGFRCGRMLAGILKL